VPCTRADILAVLTASHTQRSLLEAVETAGLMVFLSGTPGSSQVLMKCRLSREKQFRPGDKKDCRQEKRNHSDGETFATQMRAYNAANDRGCCENEAQ